MMAGRVWKYGRGGLESAMGVVDDANRVVGFRVFLRCRKVSSRTKVVYVWLRFEREPGV